MKQCTKCKQWKNINDFGNYGRSKDGLNYQCKSCYKKYKESNKENIKDRQKKGYKNNKEKIKEKSKNYNKRNKNKRKNYDNSPMPFNSKPKLRKEIELYEEVKESENGNVMCKCAYCGGWFEPTKLQIRNRVTAVSNNVKGELRLYCSYNCKQNCPIYRQVLYTKDQKPATSREVQPELRQMVFARDNYTCQKCNTHRDNLEVGIHCHHKEGILGEPLQSADMDMCITICADCHKEVHGIDGCGYYEMRCA